MDTLSKHNSDKIRKSNQVLTKMRKRYQNKDKNVYHQASKEKKYICSTPMHLSINRKLFDLSVVSDSSILNQTSDSSLNTTVGHFKDVCEDNPSTSPFPFVYNLPIHKMMIYESDDETYERAQITTRQTQKKMVCRNSNKKTKNQTKGSLDNQENLNTNVFISSSPEDGKVGQTNKIRKIHEIPNKHIFKSLPPAQVSKKNKIQSFTKKNDVLSPSIVEEKVKQTINMETRSPKLINEIVDNQINLENNIIQSNHLVTKEVLQNKHINMMEEVNNDKSNSGTQTSKNLEEISNNQENSNKNESSYSMLNHQKGNTTNEIEGNNVDQPASSIIGDGEDSNKNIYQSPLSVLQKHKNKLDTGNIINKVKCNDVDVDKDFIENTSSVKKKVFQKKKISILKVSNKIMENPIDVNHDMLQYSHSMCDEVVQKNKINASTMKIINERVDHQEYADDNSFTLNRSIVDEVLHNNIDEPSTVKKTDDLLNKNILHKDELLNSLSLALSDKTDTISSKVAEKESKNRENISKMQKNRIPSKERIEEDVSYPGKLNQAYLSSCDKNEDEITNDKETRFGKRKMENNGMAGCKNSKTQTFSERAISNQLPLGNNGRIDVIENGERKTMKCFGRFPLPQKASVSVTASLHNSQFTAGVVELQPKGFIDTECSERFGLYYFVLEGTAEFGIGNCSKMMRLGDCCFVPKSTPYYIVNISLSEKLIINFCKIC